ncbi:MAG: PAS domain-containing protein [Oscillospiraceae bacterium]|nr:PAS domain-containing protein [Oscillospiraceae bacterium]
MELAVFFKSVIDQDRAPVVLCDLAHTIVYMNPAATTRYAGRGGADLIGRNLKDCHSPQSNQRIDSAVDWFRADKSHNLVFAYRMEKENSDVYMVALRDTDGTLIGYYEKHESRTNETMKQYDLY